MTRKSRKTQAEKVEDYRIALENSEKQPQIAANLEVFGYTKEVIAQGKALFTACDKAIKENKREDDETLDSKKAYDQATDNLDERYRLDRKKGKIVFLNDITVKKQLGLTGDIPSAYVEWIDTTKSFYNTLIENKPLLDKLARLNFKIQDAKAGLKDIEAVESTRVEYLREVGESEDATKAKNAAFIALDKWMREFKSVAKIAMEDQPQLLEALGILVRS